MGARKVALALESSGPGGAERVLLHLASGLRAAGVEVLVVTLREGWMTERARREGFQVRTLPQRPGIDPGWVLRFTSVLRHERVDVLHSHEFTMNVYGGSAAVMARVRHVATLHGRRWVADRTRRILAYRALRRLGMRLVAVSDDLAAYLAAAFRISRSSVRVVHNGIPVREAGGDEGSQEASRLRASLGLGPEARLLLAVGNLYPVKDHATLVAALARLPTCSHLAIAGRGSEESKLRSLAEELGVDDRVHLLGLRDDIEDLLAAADVFVQPSRSEGLPMAVLEAMHAALPVVVTRVGGVPEAVVEGKNGHLVRPGDPDAMAAAISRIQESADGGASLGREGRSLARERFSIDTMLQGYLALYEA